MRAWLLILLAVLTAFPARADVAQDRKACVKPIGHRADPEKRRAACRRLIATGRFKGRALAILWTNLGAALGSENKERQAIVCYDKAIAADPTYWRGWQSRGVGYWNLEQYGRALADLGHAIRLNPNARAPLTNRCRLYAQLGAYAWAIRDCKRAIRIKVDDWNAAELARAYALAGKSKLGLIWANRSLKLNPRFGWAYQVRGDIYRKLGRRQDAIRDYRQALKLADYQVDVDELKKGLAKLGATP
jgi:tetratricopeptide (TPR) repeat protein